ncbi:MAG: penicillin-binding transpeptidase domain-containing protein [Firmicutes bacterium]|nr:penicillin-binding transpeptidase domain-containing protein [Bacillota bacterium]
MSLKGRHKRMVAIGVALGVVIVGLAARVGYVSLSGGQAFALGDEWIGHERVAARRGTIYDAAGDRLAVDVPAYDLDVDAGALARLPAPERANFAQALARVLHLPETSVWGQLFADTSGWVRWSPVLTHVSLARKRAVVGVFEKFGQQQSVNPWPTFARIYPSGSLAAAVVGFVAASSAGGATGQAGVELSYNRALAGKSGEQVFRQDALGNPIPFDPIRVRAAVDGDSVWLTIDPAIQTFAQDALLGIQRRFDPKHAAIIVADPRTGAILAMATLPTYNPNEYFHYTASTLAVNWAISAPFEPGSTFKIVTLTGALATHAIRLSQTYVSGVDLVDGVAIHDWNVVGWGRITYRQAMILSSNVGFIHIGQAEGPVTLARYIHLFGMDRPTGIDLPGEGTSILFDPHNINPVDFATTTFGQGLAVTPIQQVQAVDAIANGGLVVTPYVVSKVVTPTGKTVYEHRVHVVDRVASLAVMRQITQVMVQDIVQDPERKAVIPGYEVAGKTGTANIPNGRAGYYANRYNLSFIGFAPAQDPQLAIYVTVSEPHHAIQFGNDVASPAARAVLAESLRYLRVPRAGQQPGAAMSQAPRGTWVAMPAVVGRNLANGRAELAAVGLSVDSTGAGRILEQWPLPGARVASGRAVLLVGLVTPVDGMVQVPRVAGLPIEQALRLLARTGLQPVLRGDGYALTQSVAAGTRVPLGEPIRVTFGL